MHLRDDPRIVRGMTAQLALRRQRLDAGDKPLGWKVGFGAPAILERFKISGPLVGFLTHNARVAPGGTVSLAGWTKPVAEPEVAVDAILKSVAASPVLGYRGPFILEGKMPAVPLADVTLQQKDMLLALNLGRTLGSPTPLAAAANEMMNACRGLGIDHNDFVTAHEVYRRLGGQS